MTAEDYVGTLDRIQSAYRREVGDLVLSVLRAWPNLSETEKSEVYKLLREHEDSNLMLAHRNTQCLGGSMKDYIKTLSSEDIRVIIRSKESSAPVWGEYVDTSELREELENRGEGYGKGGSSD